MNPVCTLLHNSLENEVDARLVVKVAVETQDVVMSQVWLRKERAFSHPNVETEHAGVWRMNELCHTHELDCCLERRRMLSGRRMLSCRRCYWVKVSNVCKVAGETRDVIAFMSQANAWMHESYHTYKKVQLFKDLFHHTHGQNVTNKNDTFAIARMYTPTHHPLTDPHVWAHIQHTSRGLCTILRF